MRFYTPQDRAYSVPQLFDFIERGQLTFGPWVKQAPYSPQCGVMARLPRAFQLAELSLAEQFAAVELFRGTMVRHSVIVYRDDNPRVRQRISFAGDAWLRYVPIRTSETICVQERLPPGAAVLINRSHSYTDLLLTISPAEKRLLDAIDGKRTINEILKGTPPSSTEQPQRDMALTFFGKLWWHDQVVFDASRY
jgi:hypothetical protein